MALGRGKNGTEGEPFSDANSDYAGFAEWIFDQCELRDEARDYLSRRKLDPDRLAVAGWRSLATVADRAAWRSRADSFGIRMPMVGGHTLLLPQWDLDGRVATYRYRRIPRGRTMTLPGDKGRIYGMESLGSESTVDACEGEFDAESLRELGVPAVGLPGAGSLHRKALDAVLGAEADTLVIWFDPDQAGSKAGKRLRDKASRKGLRVKRILGASSDVNDLLVEGSLQELVDMTRRGK